MLQGKGCQRSIGHERTADLGIRYLRSKNTPELLPRSDHRHVRALEPGVDNTTGIWTR
jgi:hypothetical protein